MPTDSDETFLRDVSDLLDELDDESAFYASNYWYRKRSVDAIKAEILNKLRQRFTTESCDDDPNIRIVRDATTGRVSKFYVDDDLQ